MIKLLMCICLFIYSFDFLNAQSCYTDNLKSGKDLYKKRNYKAALDDFTAASRCRGTTVKEIEKVNEWISRVNNVLKNPTPAHTVSHDDDYYYNRGCNKSKLKNYNGAIADYTRAIQLNSNYGDAFYNRAIAKNELENYDGAVADYTKAIELLPDDSDPYFFRGNAYYMLQKYDAAMEDYSAAINIDSTLTGAYVNRGDTYRFTNKLVQACKDYKKAQNLGDVDGKDNFEKYCKTQSQNSSIAIDKIDLEIKSDALKVNVGRAVIVYPKFTITNAKGKEGEVNAYFYLADHKTKLKDVNKKYFDENGTVSTWTTISPGYEPTDYNIKNYNLSLFIPYDELDLDKVPGKTYSLSLYVVVHIDRELIISSAWYDFEVKF